jgi:hypothetical protein
MEVEVFMDKIMAYINSINNSPLGFAYHRIICNQDGKPIDYEFLDVNESFENMTGLWT